MRATCVKRHRGMRGMVIEANIGGKVSYFQARPYGNGAVAAANQKPGQSEPEPGQSESEQPTAVVANEPYIFKA